MGKGPSDRLARGVLLSDSSPLGTHLGFELSDRGGVNGAPKLEKERRERKRKEKQALEFTETIDSDDDDDQGQI